MPTGAIALARGRDLVVVQPDGSGERTLLTVEPGVFISDPAWSPDGSRIVFSRYTVGAGDPIGGADLFWVATTGTPEPAPLVRRDHSGAMLATPSWMPDGSGLVFENVGLPGPTGTAARVEWVDANGGGRR
ncbi:MAG: PD40 domain-containing protein, partial [Thermomicrobiales bacterium]|nr:PD40 domain-containing protein [Thermomicrobiales bacterium]